MTETLPTPSWSKDHSEFRQIKYFVAPFTISGESVIVSTVLIAFVFGFAGPDICSYETRVFGLPSFVPIRYSTRQEAEEGHRRTVESVMAHGTSTT